MNDDKPQTLLTRPTPQQLFILLPSTYSQHGHTAKSLLPQSCTLQCDTPDNKRYNSYLFARNSKAGFLEHRSIENLHVKQMHLPISGHNLPGSIHNHMAILKPVWICAAALLEAAKRQPQAVLLSQVEVALHDCTIQRGGCSHRLQKEPIR